MIKTLSFDVLTAVFIGADIFGLEDTIDLNEVAPEGYVIDYGASPEDYWKAHGLDYFCGNWREEWAGISLERIKREFGEYSFNDLRMYVRAKLGELGIDVDFSDISWHTVTMVVECE